VTDAAAPAEAAPAPPLLRLERVSKTFPNCTMALDALSLAIGQGEFVSLLGPSGCGKSTALRLIAGLIAPSGGDILWSDGGRGEHRALSFVFQEPTLMPWATAFDNVMMPLKLRGMHRTQAAPRVLEALAQVGLPDSAGAYPRELSGGMKMRVSIARALVTEPTLLLMDEPFAALDEITRFRLNQDLLRLYRERAMTIVFVTHSIYESVFLSSRVVVMAPRPGRVVSAIDVPLAYPRPEALRSDAAYNRLCNHLSEALHTAMAPRDFL
jgi:NitT/TauT family transport system ATP-binding protein